MTCLLFQLLLLFVLPASVTIPAGTELQVRLTTEVSSDKPSGQNVTAVVTAPVFSGSEVAIDAGTNLKGKTADAIAAVPAGDTASEKPAKLRLQFDQIESAGGGWKPLAAIVADVDNARETVDQSGLIVGITASETYKSRLDQGLSKLAARNSQMAQILSGVEDAMVKKVDPSITYKPGIDLTIKLTRDLSWAPPAKPNSVAPVSPADKLDALVTAEPFRTVAQNPPKPSDMTNLMFIGTQDQITKAFTDAGWFPASALGRESKMETARALIENRGYSEAPMSILNLEGQPPTIALQKQNDTFAKRHHIRIWKRPDTFNGKPVFVAAATHDTSITFSPESHNFTHGIDPNIDKERSKVVNDMLFTKQVHALALVDRPAIPKDASNATGDKLITDGKMAVLEF
jgi:LssY C-terminus